MKKNKIKNLFLLLSACLFTSTSLADATDGSYIAPVNSMHQIPQQILVYKKTILSDNHQTSYGSIGYTVNKKITFTIHNPLCDSNPQSFSAFSSIISTGEVGRTQSDGQCGIHYMTANASVLSAARSGDNTTVTVQLTTTVSANQSANDHRHKKFAWWAYSYQQINNQNCTNNTNIPVTLSVYCKTPSQIGGNS